MPKKPATARSRLLAESEHRDGNNRANAEGEPLTKLTRRLFRDAEDLVWMHLHLPYMRGLAHGSLLR